MPIQKKHQKALLTLHDITRARSKHGPGEPSPQGFRRLGLRVPQVRAMVGAGYTFHEGVSRSAVSVPMEAMERQAHRIPKDSDIILYCS
jgi:hypothetical protein